MEQNKEYNQKYLEHLEDKIVEMRNENFELRTKIAKLNDVNNDLRQQIATVSEKNRKLSHYGQIFGQFGNTINQLHSQYERARKRDHLSDDTPKD